jgi:hypothetical protein
VPSKSQRLFSVMAVAFALLVPAVARGELRGNEVRVRMLHEEALEAYSNMEMDQALELLDRAIAMAEREGLTGDLLAQLNVTYGTVLVLGLNRLSDGRERLLQAARESTNVEPDPMLSTPLLDQLWQDVVAEARPNARPTVGEGEGEGQGGGQGGGHVEPPPTTFGQSAITHEPVTEQLPGHAVPIYAEVQQGQGAARVVLAYRGPDMRGFLSVDMAEHGDGYAGRVPCHRVRPPRVEYFINVLDDAGDLIAHSGTEDDPHVVTITEELDGSEPRLPGQGAEPPCSEDTQSTGQDERPLHGGRRRLVYFDVMLGTGAGVPIATGEEQNTCEVMNEYGSLVTLADKIRVNASLAWTELVVSPAIGFFITPAIALGIQGRLQFPGAVYPGTPIAGGITLDFRYFPVLTRYVRFFIGIGLGAGSVRHPISLQSNATINCGNIYYRESRYFLGQLQAGVIIDVNDILGFGARFDFSILAPDLSVQGDLTFGLNISIPRSGSRRPAEAETPAEDSLDE